MFRIMYDNTYRVFHNMRGPLQGWTADTDTMKKVHIIVCSIWPRFQVIATFVFQWSAIVYLRRRCSKWLPSVCIIRLEFLKNCQILWHDGCELAYKQRIEISSTFYEDKPSRIIGNVKVEITLKQGEMGHMFVRTFLHFFFRSLFTLEAAAAYYETPNIKLSTSVQIHS